MFNIVFTKSTHIWQDEKDQPGWGLQYPKFAQCNVKVDTTHKEKKAIVYRKFQSKKYHFGFLY